MTQNVNVMILVTLYKVKFSLIFAFKINIAQYKDEW